MLEGDRWIGDQLHSRFSWEQSRPLSLVLVDENQFFQHRSDHLTASFDYHYQSNALIGMSYRGFDIDKSLAETGQNRKQELRFDSLTIYWSRMLSSDYELTIGSQYDTFRNQLRNLTSPNQHFDYTFKTLQGYATLYHSYSLHTAWDLGLYLGKAKEEINHLNSNIADTLDNSLEAKLRTSWEYHAADRNSTLIFHFSFNLDNLNKRASDGAGASYQMIF